MKSLVRIEGPDPPDVGPWTHAVVLKWMIATWKADRRETFENRPSSIHSAQSWCALYIPQTHPMRGKARDYLLAYVWASAEGESFRDLCNRRGWSRSTAHRWARWALDHIVSGLDAESEGAR